MFSKLNSKEEFSPTFEISVVVRDSLGNPTRKRKEFRSDNGYDIWEFFNRYQGKPKKRKKKEDTGK